MSTGQVLGLVAGLAAALLFGLAAVAQAHAVRRFDAGPPGLLAFVLRSARDPWTLGVVVAYLAGFVLHAVAIWLLPLYLAQAAIAMSLPVTALTSTLLLHERLTPAHWSAVAAVTAGLVLLAAGSGEAGPIVADVRFAVAIWLGVAAHALARELRIPLVSNQPQYSMLWRVIEAEVVPTCQELGIGQIVWSPIAQGVLTGKYAPGQAPPAGSRATDDKGGADMIKRWMEDDVLERVQRLRPIAEEAGLSLAQLAVAWVLQNDNVSAAIIGASRPEQVTDNVKAAGVRLDEATLKAIDEVIEPVVERDPAKTQSPSRREF